MTQYFSSLNQYRDNISSDYLNYVAENKRRQEEKAASQEKEYMLRQKQMIEAQIN